MRAIDLNRIDRTLTSKRWVWIYGEPLKEGYTLFNLLSKNLPHIDSDSWSARAEIGGLFINGREVYTDLALEFPCKIEYYEPKYSISKIEDHFPKFSKDHLLYEDEDLVIVFKPVGLPTMPAKEQKLFSLKSNIERYLNRTIHIPSRLDTSTQGLVIGSKTERMNRSLQKLYEARQINKSYLLEVEGSVPWNEDTANGRIGKDPIHPILRKVVEFGGKEAVTIFSKIREQTFTNQLGELSNSTLLLAKPLTGRTHQIRVHSRSIGYPIIGDNFYVGTPAAELHLLSYGLSFNHPYSDVKALDIKVPASLCPPWAII